jgi:ATP-dependent Clp protease protease subunit
MSAGFWIMSAGHKRFAHSYATLMLHTLRGGLFGDIQTITEDLDEYERIHKVLEGILLKNTNITQDKLDQIRKEKKDWFISGQEAKKYGVVDEVF